MVDIFERLAASQGGPLGQYMESSHGYFTFPRLEGELSPHMNFNGKEVLNWSLNNYLGLANHPEVRRADVSAAADYGLAYPMGARMMSGNTSEHEELERELSEFLEREATMLINYGYQGMVSLLDAVLSHRDVVVYDCESHACIIDGLRLHRGKRFVYGHNDLKSLRLQLEHATQLAEKQGGGVLVVTEGVFGMKGDLGFLDKIVELKNEFDFRILVDDAHGFGTMGASGRGTAEHFGLNREVDILFGTFAKSMASIGGFISAPEWLLNQLRYNMRSQIYAKSLPIAIVKGLRTRLRIVREDKILLERLWMVTRSLQSSLRAEGFNIGVTESPVTPIYLKGGVNEATNLVVDLRENHALFCSIVLYPVIPKGEIILRVIPTAVHTEVDVERTIEAFKAVRERLNSGYYSSMEMPQMALMKA